MKYVHAQSEHPLIDPEVILPLVIDVIKPESVIDIGCGIGTFLHIAKDLGVKRVVGVDGDWVDREVLREQGITDEFVSADLASLDPSELGRFDLALCLEVAEHLEPMHARHLVYLLISLSDVILFSAAVPGQEGQGHINEQWPSYWADLFAEYGFRFRDVIRPLIWDDERVSPWYRQNTFLVVKESSAAIADSYPTDWSSGKDAPLALVHPALFEDRTRKHNERTDAFFSGRLKSRSYLYLLFKSVFRKRS